MTRRLNWLFVAAVLVVTACAPAAAPAPTAAPVQPTALPKAAETPKPAASTAPAAAVSPVPTVAKPTGELPTVNIAASRGLVSMPIWNVANTAAKYGFKVEMKVIVTYADQQRAVASGDADVATTGINNPAIALSNGITNIRFIAGQQWAGQNLVVRKGLDVKTWKDLEGKKIGVAPGTYARVLFLIAARQHNVDLNKVDLVNVDASGATALQALQRAELDGFVLFAPTTDIAVVDGTGSYPAGVDIGDTDFGDANGGIFANTAFLQKQDLALSFMKAYLESLNQMATDEAAFVKLGTQVSGVNEAVAREAYKHIRFGYNIDENAIVAAAKLGPEFGYATQDLSGKVKDILDYGLLTQVTGKSQADLSKPVPKKS